MLCRYDKDNNAIINPCDMVDKVENMPNVAIACFSRTLFDKVVSGFNGVEIARLKNTNGDNIIYEIEYNNKKIALFMISVGAPAAVNDFIYRFFLTNYFFF